ncbi:MAG: GNAT family N-acetyltransferase, partial [Bacteroidetes bacterium]
VIDLQKPFFFQKRRERSIEKARKLNLHISEKFEAELFWETLLIPNLQNRFKLKPVHNILEINDLHQKFPDHISLHQIFLENELLAGAMIWQNQQSVHAQYIAGSDFGKKSGALDFLFAHLIKKRYADQHFFSFGISTSDPQTLNQGLLDWKTGFGAKIVLHDIYKIETKNYINL